MRPGRFVLLLEDLSTHRFLTSGTGLTKADITSVVKALAASHAAWWQSPRLNEFKWLRSIASDAERRQSSFLAAWPVVVDPLGGGTPDVGALGGRIAKEVFKAQERLASPPITLLHMDICQENLFFDGNNQEPVPIFIDWQIVRSGRGPASLATFLAFLPQRDMLEDDLLAQYHQELESLGVDDYPFSDCVEDYRLGIPRRCTGPISALASVGPDSAQATAILELLSRFGMDNLRACSAA